MPRDSGRRKRYAAAAARGGRDGGEAVDHGDGGDVGAGAASTQPHAAVAADASGAAGPGVSSGSNLDGRDAPPAGGAGTSSRAHTISGEHAASSPGAALAHAEQAASRPRAPPAAAAASDPPNAIREAVAAIQRDAARPAAMVAPCKAICQRVCPEEGPCTTRLSSDDLQAIKDSGAVPVLARQLHRHHRYAAAAAALCRVLSVLIDHEREGDFIKTHVAQEGVLPVVLGLVKSKRTPAATIAEALALLASFPALLHHQPTLELVDHVAAAIRAYPRCVDLCANGLRLLNSMCDICIARKLRAHALGVHLLALDALQRHAGKTHLEHSCCTFLAGTMLTNMKDAKAAVHTGGFAAALVSMLARPGLNRHAAAAACNALVATATDADWQRATQTAAAEAGAVRVLMALVQRCIADGAVARNAVDAIGTLALGNPDIAAAFRRERCVQLLTRVAAQHPDDKDLDALVRTALRAVLLVA